MKRHSIQNPVQSRRRGQGLIEYIIIIASVALIALVALSLFGHKVADQYAICLLYTSPSPRDQRGSRMPSSA